MTLEQSKVMDHLKGLADGFKHGCTFGFNLVKFITQDVYELGDIPSNKPCASEYDLIKIETYDELVKVLKEAYEKKEGK